MNYEQEILELKVQIKELQEKTDYDIVTDAVVSLLASGWPSFDGDMRRSGGRFSQL